MLLSASASPNNSSIAPTQKAAVSYSDSQRSLLHHFAEKFSRYTPSFSAQAIQDHLRFYQAIQKLLSPVAPHFVEKDIATGIKSPVVPVRVFLHKALARFEVWLEKIVLLRASNAPFSLEEVPPLDVLSILHGYLLAPWTFDEDASFRVPALSKLPEFPLGHMKTLIDMDGNFTPSEAQIRLWESATQLPFDIENDHQIPRVMCPRCDELVAVPWTQSEIPSSVGTGFAEPAFAHVCPSCQFSIDNNSLCVKKFVNDLTIARELNQTFLAGTILGGVGNAQLSTASAIAAEVVKTLGDPTNELGDRLSWNMAEARRRLFEDPTSKLMKANIDNLLRPYMQPSRFSADLIYKAALQGEFAVISSSRGMYRPSILQGETKEFEDAIRAYRLFVKLTLLPHLPKVYPTYAVDLVWHTHQLQGRNYKAQTQDLVGIFLDHRSVDQITPTAYIFDKEREAWRAALKAAGLESVASNGAALPPSDPEGEGGKHGSGCNCGGAGCGPSGPPPPDCSISASQALLEDSILADEMLEEARNAVYQPEILPPAEQLKALLGEEAFATV